MVHVVRKSLPHLQAFEIMDVNWSRRWLQTTISMIIKTTNVLCIFKVFYGIGRKLSKLLMNFRSPNNILYLEIDRIARLKRTPSSTLTILIYKTYRRWGPYKYSYFTLCFWTLTSKFVGNNNFKVSLHANPNGR